MTDDNYFTGALGPRQTNKPSPRGQRRYTQMTTEECSLCALSMRRSHCDVFLASAMLSLSPIDSKKEALSMLCVGACCVWLLRVGFLRGRGTEAPSRIEL